MVEKSSAGHKEEEEKKNNNEENIQGRVQESQRIKCTTLPGILLLLWLVCWKDRWMAGWMGACYHKNDHHRHPWHRSACKNCSHYSIGKFKSMQIPILELFKPQNLDFGRLLSSNPTTLLCHHGRDGSLLAVGGWEWNYYYYYYDSKDERSMVRFWLHGLCSMWRWNKFKRLKKSWSRRIFKWIWNEIM